MELKSLLDSEQLSHGEALSLNLKEGEKLQLRINSLEEVNSSLMLDVERFESNAENDSQRIMSILKEKELVETENLEIKRLYEEQTISSRRQMDEQKSVNVELSEKVATLMNEKEVDLKQQQNMITNLGEELVHSEKAQEELSRKLHSLEMARSNLQTQKEVAVSISKSSQTKLVEVTEAPLTHILKSIANNKVKFPTAGTTEILHRSIKSLQCIVTFTKLGPEQVRCDILVIKGEGICKYKDLLSLTSTASNEKLAKANAFDVLLTNITKFEQGD